MNQINRQISSTANHTKVDGSSLAQLDECASMHGQDFSSTMPDQQQLEQILITPRKQTYSDADSGTDEIELQMEQLALTNANDNEDQASVKSFEANGDEGFSENEDPYEQMTLAIKTDLNLAKTIPDDMKKSFCPDTKVAFHGEFARLISLPLSLCHNTRYYFFAQEELLGGPYEGLNYGYLKLDNAKAQFQCPNPKCGHAWTSMRARVSFLITPPTVGLIVVKIFGQDCQRCCQYTQALWYIDEVCRVMKNLARTFYEYYFADMLNYVDLEIQVSAQSEAKRARFSRHDPSQRKGKMMAQHVKEFCEACRYGLCFA